MPGDKIFELIGQMLGANQRSAEGEVLVELGSERSDAYIEHFWHDRQRRWRVERSDGLVFTEHVGVESATVAGGHVERGPAAGFGRFAAGQLLAPRLALIWGRPGEAWRLSGELDDLGDGRWQLGLCRTDGSNLAGRAVVEEHTGIVHELQLDQDRLTIRMLDLYPDVFSRRGVDWLLQV